ncbi:MAG: phosphotransferase [Longispora sp.]|nr:phosphotransferase [Longispora sp. (in: high G+C Gram-positive bacteria)]
MTETLRRASEDAVVLSDRAGGLVVRRGDVVTKTHPSDTDPTFLARRLRAAAHPLLRDLLLPPLDPELGVHAGRLVTHWPAGEPVAADEPDSAPWEQAAELLAALHRVPADAVFGADPPPAGGPARLGRGMTALVDSGVDGPAVRAVFAAFRQLPDWVRHQRHQPPGMVTHGDWHLGQLVWRTGRWWMIDIDDLGTGEPAWDLARPAAYFSAGLLPPDVWHRFVETYRAAGGPAIATADDPWSVLDVPARALVVQMAAHSLVKADQAGRPLDELETTLVDTCQRIVTIYDGGKMAEHC